MAYLEETQYLWFVELLLMLDGWNLRVYVQAAIYFSL